MNDIQVSQNFKLREFQCKGNNCCSGAVKLHSELLKRLQAMRTEANAPVRINSGYRCAVHNSRVGSNESSQHRRGTAADIVIVGWPIARQRALCEAYFPDGGIGYANTFTHVDTRGSRARWNY